MSDTPDLSSNPLVNPPSTPYGAPPFDRIRAEHYEPAMDWAIAKAKANIEAIKNNPDAPTFENTIDALVFADEDLDRISGIYGNMTVANMSPELKAVEDSINTKLTSHSSDILFDDVLFARIEALYKDFEKKPAKYAHLSDDQKLLLKDTYEGFTKSGALLPPEGKEELRALKEKLSTLTTAFKNNVVASIKGNTQVIDSEADLDGVPERAKEQYKAVATQAGTPDKWLVPLSPSYYIDILDYGKNRELRRKIQEASSSIAYGGQHDNRPVLMEIVQLRHRKAQLLGKNNYAELILEDRMAKNPETVMAFLERNLKTYRVEGEKHRQAVMDFARQKDGITDFKSYDFAYYERQLQEQTYQIDLEELRPYFDLEKVLDGLRQHAEKLFDIEMKEETSGKYPVYHPDVKVYEVFSKKTGAITGVFYADYYARPGEKKEGAWMNVYRNRGLNGKGENEFPFVTNVCNFAKPTENQPTLLSLDEVRTVFHEFGHGLHALLAEGDYKSQTGTNVKWDWVELPSQLQENWAKQKEVLDTFARHKDTGEQLPASLIAKVREMDNFGAGYMGHRQTFLGLLDMTWYTTDPAVIASPEALENSVIAKTGVPAPAAGLMSTRFSHIFSGGYAAGYYSYKWAEVLEADVFEEFSLTGLYNRAAADRLKATIYSQGGRKEPDKLFRDFRGRDPDPDALFRREGLLRKGSAGQPPNPAP